MTWLRASWLILPLFAGCGGVVVLEDPGAGGGSGASSSSTSKSASSAKSVSSASSGGGFCTTHEDCAPNLCLFDTGECAEPCVPGSCDSCGPGKFCEPCGTASCPACKNCIPVCRDIEASRCDDDDPCPPGGVCVFGAGVCYPACGPNGQCNDGFSFCEPCASGSCCGCDDCVGACLGGE